MRVVAVGATGEVHATGEVGTSVVEV